MKETQKSRYICLGIIILVLTLFCASATACSEIKPSHDRPYSNKIYLVPVDEQEDDTNTVPIETYEPNIYDKLSSLVSSGEIDGYVCGDTLHVVFKSIEASFNEGSYMKLGVIDSQGNYFAQLSRYDYDSDETTRVCWFMSSFEEGYPVKHIGNDMFVGLNWFGVMIYNAKNNTAFRIEKKEKVPGTSGFYYVMELDPIFDGFYDGVVITKETSTFNHNSYVVFIYPDGTITKTNISTKVESFSSINYSVGIYSDGLFWAFGSFWDINERLVIDLSEYNVVNTPVFYEGVASIVIKSNGKHWETEITKQGTFLYEPVECYWEK